MDKKKVFVVFSIARQVDGEYCVAKAEKAFSQASKADEYSKNLARKYAETIPTPTGPMACICERAVFEIEVEDS
jgi:hypothetical protein